MNFLLRAKWTEEKGKKFAESNSVFYLSTSNLSDDYIDVGIWGGTKELRVVLSCSYVTSAFAAPPRAAKGIEDGGPKRSVWIFCPASHVRPRWSSSQIRILPLIFLIDSIKTELKPLSCLQDAARRLMITWDAQVHQNLRSSSPDEDLHLLSFPLRLWVMELRFKPKQNEFTDLWTLYKNVIKNSTLFELVPHLLGFCPLILFPIICH